MHKYPNLWRLQIIIVCFSNDIPFSVLQYLKHKTRLLIQKAFTVNFMVNFSISIHCARSSTRLSTPSRPRLPGSPIPSSSLWVFRSHSNMGNLTNDFAGGPWKKVVLPLLLTVKISIVTKYIVAWTSIKRNHNFYEIITF